MPKNVLKGKNGQPLLRSLSSDINLSIRRSVGNSIRAIFLEVP